MGQQISASQLDKIRNQIRKRQNEQERFQQKMSDNHREMERLSRQLKDGEYQYLTQLVQWTDFPTKRQDLLIGCILECKDFLASTPDITMNERCQGWRQRYVQFCKGRKIQPIPEADPALDETPADAPAEMPQSPSLEGGEAV